MNLTVPILKATYDALGYPWHPVFNLGAVRAREQFTNAFDDIIFYVLTLSNGETEFAGFNGTTDPGFQKHGDQIPEGTATMLAGFYKGLFGQGFHKGRKNHPCFKQVRPARYTRMKAGKQFDLSTMFTGNIGSNLHSTREDFTPTRVDNFSEACVVVQRWESHLKLLAAADRSMLKAFDFGLLNERQLVNV